MGSIPFLHHHGRRPPAPPPNGRPTQRQQELIDEAERYIVAYFDLCRRIEGAGVTTRSAFNAMASGCFMPLPPTAHPSLLGLSRGPRGQARLQLLVPCYFSPVADGDGECGGADGGDVGGDALARGSAAEKGRGVAAFNLPINYIVGHLLCVFGCSQLEARDAMTWVSTAHSAAYCEMAMGNAELSWLPDVHRYSSSHNAHLRSDSASALLLGTVRANVTAELSVVREHFGDADSLNNLMRQAGDVLGLTRAHNNHTEVLTSRCWASGHSVASAHIFSLLCANHLCTSGMLSDYLLAMGFAMGPPIRATFMGAWGVSVSKVGVHGRHVERPYSDTVTLGMLRPFVFGADGERSKFPDVCLPNGDLQSFKELVRGDAVLQLRVPSQFRSPQAHGADVVVSSAVSSSSDILSFSTLPIMTQRCILFSRFLSRDVHGRSGSGGGGGGVASTVVRGVVEGKAAAARGGAAVVMMGGRGGDGNCSRGRGTEVRPRHILASGGPTSRPPKSSRAVAGGANAPPLMLPADGSAADFGDDAGGGPLDDAINTMQSDSSSSSMSSSSGGDESDDAEYSRCGWFAEEEEEEEEVGDGCGGGASPRWDGRLRVGGSRRSAALLCVGRDVLLLGEGASHSSCGLGGSYFSPPDLQPEAAGMAVRLLLRYVVVSPSTPPAALSPFATPLSPPPPLQSADVRLPPISLLVNPSLLTCGCAALRYHVALPRHISGCPQAAVRRLGLVLALRFGIYSHYQRLSLSMGKLSSPPSFSSAAAGGCGGEIPPSCKGTDGEEALPLRPSSPPSRPLPLAGLQLLVAVAGEHGRVRSMLVSGAAAVAGGGGGFRLATTSEEPTSSFGEKGSANAAGLIDYTRLSSGKCTPSTGHRQPVHHGGADAAADPSPRSLLAPPKAVRGGDGDGLIPSLSSLLSLLLPRTLPPTFNFQSHSPSFLLSSSSSSHQRGGGQSVSSSCSFYSPSHRQLSIAAACQQRVPLSESLATAISHCLTHNHNHHHYTASGYHGDAGGLRLPFNELLGTSESSPLPSLSPLARLLPMLFSIVSADVDDDEGDIANGWLRSTPSSPQSPSTLPSSLSSTSTSSCTVGRQVWSHLAHRLACCCATAQSTAAGSVLRGPRIMGRCDVPQAPNDNTRRPNVHLPFAALCLSSLLTILHHVTTVGVVVGCDGCGGGGEVPPPAAGGLRAGQLRKVIAALSSSFPFDASVAGVTAAGEASVHAPVEDGGGGCGGAADKRKRRRGEREGAGLGISAAGEVEVEAGAALPSVGGGGIGDGGRSPPWISWLLQLASCGGDGGGGDGDDGGAHARSVSTPPIPSHRPSTAPCCVTGGGIRHAESTQSSFGGSGHHNKSTPLNAAAAAVLLKLMGVILYVLEGVHRSPSPPHHTLLSLLVGDVLLGGGGGGADRDGGGCVMGGQTEGILPLDVFLALFSPPPPPPPPAVSPSRGDDGGAAANPHTAGKDRSADSTVATVPAAATTALSELLGQCRDAFGRIEVDACVRSIGSETAHAADQTPSPHLLPAARIPAAGAKRGRAAATAAATVFDDRRYADPTARCDGPSSSSSSSDAMAAFAEGLLRVVAHMQQCFDGALSACFGAEEGRFVRVSPPQRRSDVGDAAGPSHAPLVCSKIPLASSSVSLCAHHPPPLSVPIPLIIRRWQCLYRIGRWSPIRAGLLTDAEVWALSALLNRGLLASPAAEEEEEEEEGRANGASQRYDGGPPLSPIPSEDCHPADGDGDGDDAELRLMHDVLRRRLLHLPRIISQRLRRAWRCVEAVGRRDARRRRRSAARAAVREVAPAPQLHGGGGMRAGCDAASTAATAPLAAPACSVAGVVGAPDDDDDDDDDGDDDDDADDESELILLSSATVDEWLARPSLEVAREMASGRLYLSIPCEALVMGGGGGADGVGTRILPSSLPQQQGGGGGEHGNGNGSVDLRLLTAYSTAPSPHNRWTTVQHDLLALEGRLDAYEGPFQRHRQQLRAAAGAAVSSGRGDDPFFLDSPCVGEELLSILRIHGIALKHMLAKLTATAKGLIKELDGSNSGRAKRLLSLTSTSSSSVRLSSPVCPQRGSLRSLLASHAQHRAMMKVLRDAEAAKVEAAEEVRRRAPEEGAASASAGPANPAEVATVAVAVGGAAIGAACPRRRLEGRYSAGLIMIAYDSVRMLRKQLCEVAAVVLEADANLQSDM